MGSSEEPIGAGSTYLRVVRSKDVITLHKTGYLALPTSLLFDLHADIIVEGKDEKVGNHVEDAHSQEDLRVVKWYSLRYLHHPKDDHKVGAVLWSAIATMRLLEGLTLLD